MSFTPLREHDLIALDDDALIAHVRAARAAGDLAQARAALGVLVYGHWSRVQRRVKIRVPKEHVEDVTGEVIQAAVQSAFDGDSPQEFLSWLNTITDRRIADFHRRNQRTPATVAVSDGHGDGGAPEPATPSHAALVETNDVIERALEAMNPVHARVAEAHVILGAPAREVAADTGVSPDNVAQIAARFRRRLREMLDRSEDP